MKCHSVKCRSPFRVFRHLSNISHVTRSDSCIVDWEGVETRGSFGKSAVGAPLPTLTLKRLSWLTRLAGAMTAERTLGETSRFSPYLNVVSSEPPLLLHRIDPATISAEAQSERLRQRIERSSIRSDACWAELVELSGEGSDLQKFTAEHSSASFGRAVDVVLSRFIRFGGVATADPSKAGWLRVMAPMLDLFNHKDRAKSSFDISPKGTITLKVGPHSKGDPYLLKLHTPPPFKHILQQ